MPFFYNYRNCKVHYQISGKGRAVVLLHGFLENNSMWNEVEKVLKEHYKIIRIDLLGHGSTENAGYIHTMEDQAEMVKMLMSSLNLRKYSLIGHSMGGYIALAFADKFPKNVKSLVLMNSTALPDTEEKVINRNRGIAVVKENFKSFVRIAIPMLFSEKNRGVFINEIEEVISEALKMTPQGVIAALEGMKIRKDRTYIYDRATFPIAMIIGKNDPALDYNSLMLQTENKPIEIVEFQDGHMSHIENEEALIRTLYSFLKKT